MAECLSTWDCTLCSFTNSSYKQSCEMCDEQRPNIISMDVLQTQFNQSFNIQDKNNNPKNVQIVKPIYMNFNEQIQPGSNANVGVNNDTSNNIQQTQSTPPTQHDNNKYNHSKINSIENMKKDQWQCKQCTYINHVNLLYCEVCFSETNMSSSTGNNQSNSPQSHHKYNDSMDQYNNHSYKQQQPSISNNNNNNYQQSSYINTWNDTDVAQQAHDEEENKMKQFYDDLEVAKRLQEQIEFDKNIDIVKQIQAKEKQRMQQFYKDSNAAKQLEQKYQADEIQFVKDRQIAQQTYAQQLSQQKKQRQFTAEDAYNPSDELIRKLKQLETENCDSIVFEDYTTPSCSSVIGEWKINYKNANHCSDLIINKGGSFVQINMPKCQNYTGKWWIKGSLMILEYAGWKLSNESTDIRLQCELNSDLNVFNGVKSHPQYIYYNSQCCLIYVGEKQ